MPKKLSLGKLPNQTLKCLIRKLPGVREEVLIPASVGADAAGLRIGGHLLSVTTDPVTFTSKDISKYAVRVNVNDIACMGCKPRWFSSAVLLPEGIDETVLYSLWQDLVDELKAYDIEPIGGHCEVTDAVTRPVIVGQLIGEAEHDFLLDPRKISAGDKILLWRGVAIEGTAVLATERFAELSKHIMPEQLETMQSLLDDPGICVWPGASPLFKQDGLVALHDPTEGGVATALHEMADIARCGLRVHFENIPILSETMQLAKVLNFDPLGLLASGSLLIVCKPDAAEEIKSKLRNERVEVIGEFTQQPERVLVKDGQDLGLPRFDQDEIVQALRKEI
jgi:hydrogenase maturation factor